MTPAGSLTTLVEFTGLNGSNPEAGLVQGIDGDFYGTTSYGGSTEDGTVFKMTNAGTLTTLVNFDGANWQLSALKTPPGHRREFLWVYHIWWHQ
jgi:uncharacterized repeat protein (TIGR03803 family)